jgi:hypothetical protein
VGIGTTSQASALHVDSSNDGPIFDSGGTGNTNHALLVRDSGNNQLLRVDNNGNVGIGTTSPQQLLHVSANNPGGKIRLEMGQTGVASDDVTGEIQFYHNDSSGAGVNADIKGICTSSIGAGALTFGTGTTSTTERMRIGTNGHLFATSGDTSLANLTLRKSAGDTIDYLQCRKTDNDLRIVLEGSGDVHNATGTFSAISDEKLKENIVDASSQWDDIKNIKIRNFSLKADKLSEANMIGVVAQEIEKVSPNLVKERIDTDPDTGEDLGTKTKIVKYSILHTKAVKALQEAMERIETLEAEVKTLKGE